MMSRQEEASTECLRPVLGGISGTLEPKLNRAHSKRRTARTNLLQSGNLWHFVSALSARHWARPAVTGQEVAPKCCVAAFAISCTETAEA